MTVIKAFHELSLDELYDLLALRQRVFSVEQECVYLDCDGHDRKALHLLTSDASGLVAYARIFAPGIKYGEACIGRVVTSSESRGKGEGRAIVRRAVEAIGERFGSVAIRISAQQHLERFYAELGFTRASDPYLEDEIPHIEMLRSAALETM